MSTVRSTNWVSQASSAHSVAGWSRARSAAWPVWRLAALFVLLAYRSWGTWPDPLIDFGRELYVPWRMAEGDVLYRDLAYFNGPLSPSINALLFWAFGASLRALVWTNLGLLAVTTWMMHRALRRMSTPLTATIGSTSFLLLFAFAQYLPVRNYNYVCPYSHEMTHGLLLSAAALLTVWSVSSIGGWAYFASGVIVGLVALTKVEITIAAAAGVAAFAFTTSLRDFHPLRALFRSASLMFAGATIPVLTAIAACRQWMPLGESIEGCLGGWLMAMSDEIRSLDFYRRGMGTLDLGASLNSIGVSTVRWAFLLAAGFALARNRAVKRHPWIPAGIGVLSAAVLWISGFNWPLMERALPLLVGALLAWRLTIAIRATTNQSDPSATSSFHREASSVSWCVFALVLMAKMLLNARISHYGFVLAAPAVTVVILAVFHWLPRAITSRGGHGGAIAWLAAPLLAAYACAYQLHQGELVARDVLLGHGSDQFFASAEAEDIATAFTQIETHVAQEETVAILPEGIMLNYLARRPTSVPFITWMPPEALHFGEANMLAALQASPPDWVILAPRDLREYGVPQFAGGYLDSAATWINANYRIVDRWGDGEWRLLRRVAPTASEYVSSEHAAN